MLEDWSYDYKNRLAKYRSFNGSGGVVSTVSWTNDPLDRPVAEASTASGSTTSYAFTYIGASDLLAQEVLTGATSATRTYAYDAFDRRATMSDNASRYSYLFDPHGSVSLLVDYAGSNPVKASYGYTAYGAAVSGLTRTASGFNASVNAYRYTGKRLDTASNTFDMGARRYALDTDRFLQVDQYHGALANLRLALDPLTQNRYALAAGNPVTYVETDGHYFAKGIDADGVGDGAAPKTPTAQVPVARPTKSESTSVANKKKKAVGVTLIVVGAGLSALSAIHVQDCLNEVATFYGIPLVWARAACLHMLANTAIRTGSIVVGVCTVLSIEGYGKLCLPKEKRSRVRAAPKV